MTDPARSRATYEDVLAAPRHPVAENITGELRLMPRPAKPHAAAATALGEELGPPFKRGRGGPGGWILLDGPAPRRIRHATSLGPTPRPSNRPSRGIGCAAAPAARKACTPPRQWR
jgi:hypothetical protein